jgi:uncharacterized protein (TIGR02099 family)
MSLLATVFAAAKRPARWARSCTKWAVALVLLAWGLVLLAWLVLHWAILPHIDEWRPALEKQASKSLGLNLQIGQIEVRSGGWIPALEMRDVRLIDSNGREALRLPRVVAALSARSLLALELRFEQLLIDAPEMVVRRDAQGRIFVAGLSVDEAERAEAGGDLADWFFVQHEFVILNGRVRWIDEARQAPPLELSAVNLVLRNGLRQHELRLDATPPPAWGERLSLRGQFTQSLLKRPGDLQHWSGQLFADLPRADVRELRRYLDLPFELTEGDGALRAWLEIKQGQSQAATLDLGLRAVKLKLGKRIEALELAQIAGRLAMQRNAQGLSFTARQLGFEDGAGLVWPRSDWSLTLRTRQASQVLGAELGELLGGELTAQQMDLGLAARIMARLPVPAAAHQLAQEMAPSGRVSAFSARWEGSPEAPQSYRIKGALDQLSLSAGVPADAHSVARPGLAGAQLQFDATEKGGTARLSVRDGMLDFPGVFEEPRIPLQTLSAGLDWRIEAGKEGPPLVELRVSDLHLQNEDVKAEFEASWRTGAKPGSGRGARLPGYLDLSGRIEQAPARRVARYLPLSVGETARSYVRDAIRGGEAHQVQARVRGDLADFPFDGAHAAGGGIFRISSQVKDVELAYVPSHAATATEPAYTSPWPVMEQLNAELIFERGSMQIRKGRAKVMGYELFNVNGGIPDLAHQAQLEMEGQGRGPMAELLRFMRSSPLSEWTSHGLDAASASGNAGLKLGLKIPLMDASKSSVKGQVLLAGNELRLRPDVPLFSNTRARIEFDRKGVQLQAAGARVLGGETTFEGGSQADGSLRFTAQGQLNAEALRRAGELGLPSRLAQFMSGATGYKLELGFVRGQTEFALSSSLQGLGLDLPAPLRKEADSALNLRLQSRLLPANGNDGATRDELRLELGNLLQAHYQRELGGESAQVLRGALSVQDNLPPLPPSGVQLQANLATFDADAWLASAQRLLGPVSLESMDSGYAPGQLALRAQNLRVAGRQLSRLVAGLSRAPGQNGWRATIDAEQLSGYLELRQARGNQPGRVYARLGRLALPKSEADTVVQLLEKQPASVPALDIVVEDFELRGKKLGRLEIDAQLVGPTREWKLARLQIKHPDAVLNATGQWVAEPGQPQRRTLLDWELDVSDGGKLLLALGQGQVLRGGKGKLAGQLGWQGSPLSPDYPSMSGQLHVALDAGQFLQAEPGVGRLLGVLSLQSLPRRLLLDFRDVFSQGFAFDSFAGDLRIDKGVAHTSNLRMVGVQAAVLMEGQADLAAETQDLRVLVVPELNVGGASLAYAAINPAIGLGTFLAQWLLRKPMAAAGTEEFHVTGMWDAPKVDRIEKSERKPPEPAASAASGAAP